MTKCDCLTCKRVKREYKIYQNLKRENNGYDLNQDTTECLERILK